MEAARPKPFKHEYPIPHAYLHQFEQEARFVLIDELAGVWIVPPEWLARVDQKMAAALKGYVLVAIPEAMARG